MKIEACIKKGKECYEESLQRSVAAEVSPGLTQMCLRDKAGGHLFTLCLLHMSQKNMAEKWEAKWYPVAHNPASLK